MFVAIFSHRDGRRTFVYDCFDMKRVRCDALVESDGEGNHDYLLLTSEDEQRNNHKDGVDSELDSKEQSECRCLQHVFTHLYQTTGMVWNMK